VRVNWGDPTAVLNVWVNGQAFPGSSGAREAVADTLTEAGEVVLYVGKIGDGSAHPDTGIHLPFTMTTTINGVEDMRPAQTWARPSGRPLTRLEHDRLAAARHW
jgi:hypothetical protein